MWLALLALATFLTRRYFKPKPRVPWKLGKLTVDLRGGSHTIHAVVAGMSGTGKSTAVLDLLMGDMPALVIAFDNSRPIRDLFEANGWTIWQPGGSIGWDILSGSPQVVSEALTAGFARTDADTGYNRGLAQMRLWATLETLDGSNQRRTLDALVESLERLGKNPDDTRACRTWANRFNRINKSLGTSLGHDLDLAECMRRGEKVLILPNRFLSPEDAPIVGGIALVQARRVAQEVGNFLIVVEEAGQAGQRQVEMNALAQAGRDRGCPLVVLTQNMAKLPEEVVNNVKVWVSFAQESRKELTFAGEHLRIEPEHLHAEVMPTGYAWIRSPEHAPTRVRLKVPKIRPLPGLDAPTGHGQPDKARRRITIREITPEPSRAERLALPMPPVKVQRVLEKIDRSQGECWLWTGGIDSDGYGYQRWEYADGRPSNNRPAHQVVWEIVNGRWFPVDEETGKPMSWDHRRTCPRHCVSPYHGEPMPLDKNIRNMHRTRGHAVAVAD